MKKTKNLRSILPLWTLIFVLVLTIQNLVIFWPHYFSNVGFPWDFPMSYYPWVAFWTAAVEKGIFPSWVPFQSMGYPFVLQLQAALFYPPFWVFPLFNIPHTLQASVAVQCLHILAGSIGMFLLLRLLVEDKRLALLSAVIFQFFGGFYGNAQHSDIIRSFALTPWALYCFTFPVEAGVFSTRLGQQSAAFLEKIQGWLRSVFRCPYLPMRAYFIPLVIFFLATGGYPGNLVAIFFILAVYVAAQLIQTYLNNRSISQVFSVGLILTLLTFLGVSMSVIQLGPSWIFRNEFSRLSNFDALDKLEIWIPQLPGLFLSSKTLPGEITETSTYITLPALIFASFILTKTIRKHWPIAVIGLVSLLMIGGNSSFFYRGMTKLFLPLALSRFPTSDYRALLAIPLIIFAVLGLRDLFQNRWGMDSLLVRTGFIVFWFFQGLYMAYWENPLVERLGTNDFGYALFAWTGLHAWHNHVLSAVAVFFVTLGLLLLLSQVQRRITMAALILLAGLIFLDGARVITDMDTWRGPRVYEDYYGRKIPLFVNGQFSPRQIFTHLPVSRPERIEVGHHHWFSWRGYIDGSYQMQDYKACPTSSCNQIQANEIYWEYMLKEWRPIVLVDGWKADESNKITVSDDLISQAASSTAGNNTGVEQTFYGLDKITYTVDLDQPVLMIENETYFPGWTAKLGSGAGGEQITAFAVNNAFRAWQLPAGRYEMEAAFHFPYFRTMVYISLASALLWFGLLFHRVFISWRMRKVQQPGA